MASERIFDDRITCQALNNEYGSDYRAILSTISMVDEQEESQPQRYILPKADWNAVRNSIS